MAIDLKGQVLVITGGGTGIGSETALEAARAGMSICLCGRRKEPLEETATRIRELGAPVLTLELDVTAEHSAAHLLDATEASLGTPWAVFANAGRGLNRTGHETTDQEMRDIFEVNFFATHRLLAEAARRMIDRGSGGHLLACASCLSRFAVPNHAAYAATKGSQDLLCQAMRLELAPHGIHVSSVHPITTTTQFFDVADQLSGGNSHRVLEDTPRMFLQPPSKVAKAIIRCLRRPRPEVWTSRIVWFASAMHALYPRLFDRKIKKMAR